MQTISKYLFPAAIALFMLIADIPLLPQTLVGDAQAVFGVRRRTAVVAYSAGSARASSAAAASASQQQTAAAQQQAYAAQQQAAEAEQEAAAAKQEAAAAQQQLAATQPAAPSPQPAAGTPVGSIATTLPGKCVPVTVANVQYQSCAGSFYRAAFQGNSLVYVVVESPL
jgi:hypothetical protein